MTVEEFQNKYKFAKNMDKTQIKDLLMFLVVVLLDIAMDEKSGKSKMEEFMDDLRSSIKSDNQ